MIFIKSLEVFSSFSFWTHDSVDDNFLICLVHREVVYIIKEIRYVLSQYRYPTMDFNIKSTLCQTFCHTFPNAFRIDPFERFFPFVISILWRDPLSNSNKRFLDSAIATLEMTKEVVGTGETNTMKGVSETHMTKHVISYF